MLRRVTPRGLYGRTFLIVVLPVVLMQSIVTYVFFERHWESVTSNLSKGAASDIALVIDLAKRSPAWTIEELNAAAQVNKMDLWVTHYEGETLPVETNDAFFSVVDRTLRDALATRLKDPFWFDTTRYPDYVEVQVATETGVLIFHVRSERVYATNGHIFILWLVGATLILVAIALIFLRNQVRPIQQLARAAEEFGRGRDAPDFRPAGASEVRRAARAFIGMRGRIKRHIHQRTALLAGVSHDLRTPLTRMRLELEMMPKTETTEALKTDVAEMEHMLEEYLAFTRDQSTEDTEMADLAALAEELRQDAERAGERLDVAAEGELSAAVRRSALKRALQNLIANAFAHADTVRLSLKEDGNSIAFQVDDDGPGIDPAQYEEAFKPFNRLDAARNQNKSGVGLGLAVARDVVRSHGGDITLAKSDLGGLQVRLQLPV